MARTAEQKAKDKAARQQSRRDERKAERRAERKDERREARHAQKVDPNSRNLRYDKRAQDFKNQKIKNVKDFNFDQHNRKDVEGTHVSGHEVKFIKGEGRQKQAYNALVAQKQAGATFGKRAQSKFDRMGARIEARQKAKAAQETAYDPPPQSSDPEYNPSTMPSNQQTATNTGDVDINNDVSSTQTSDNHAINDQQNIVYGNNSNIFANNDQSVRTYGGGNRTMIINEANTGNQNGSGVSGGYYNAADKAITMGTLGGFYAPDDSYGAQAAFVDLNQTLNRDAQKKYANLGKQTALGYSNYRAGDVDMFGLQSRIDGTSNEFFDMATVQGVRTYGDRDNAKPFGTYELGDPIKAVEFDGAETAEKYKDDIDDM